MPESKYITIGRKLGEIVALKQCSYGDSIPKTVKFLQDQYPDGIPVDKYLTVIIQIHAYEKLSRATSQPEAFDENPFKDLAGYCLLRLEIDEREIEKQAAQEINNQAAMRHDP